MVSKVFGVADETKDLSGRHECPVPGCPSTAEAHHLRDQAHRMEIAELKRKLGISDGDMVRVYQQALESTREQVAELAAAMSALVQRDEPQGTQSTGHDCASLGCPLVGGRRIHVERAPESP